MDEVDGRITVVEPDIAEMKEGSTHPFGIYIEVAGKELDEELEGVIERRIHEYCNFIEGLMHLNQRYDIWLRLSKKSFQKGLNPFKYIGKVLHGLFKSELPMIEKMQVTFITEPEKVKELYNEALQIYEARDARARGLKDEEVDKFYGCVLCRSFAPRHCCVITPQRYSNCGAISWFDGRASASINPKGLVFEIERGELLDPEKGEFSGVNEAIKKRTLDEITKVWLYIAFGYLHTSCSCFEAVAFYIPEVDGFGIVHRDYPDVGGLNVHVEAPVTRLVCGIKPETLGDLEEVLDYVETQLTHLLSVVHTEQEGSNIDFESKVFHAGMTDHVGLEVADIAQIAAYGFPKADPEAPLVDLGYGTIDLAKPVNLCIGHNVIPSVEITDYINESALNDKIEVVGLCCTAHDITRYYPNGKIVGPISWQLRFIRSGVADVVVLDEQCVRSDAFNEEKDKASVIVTSEKNCMGLPNRTNDPIESIVEDLASGETPGVIAMVGCANYPKGCQEVAEMCREFAKRRYIVVTSGCAAMSAGM